MGFMVTRQQYRNRKTGAISADHNDILPKILTLNRQFKPSRENMTTPFREVELMPAGKVINSEMRSVFAEKPSTIKQTKGELCKKLISRLKKVVSENWDSKAVNIVMHSSGLDSRILSWTIKRLHDERGNNWLGRVVFICSNPEAQSFKSIFRHVGWKPEQCFIPQDEEQGITYAPILSDFKNGWRTCSGTWMYPINMFYYLPVLALKYYRLSANKVHFWTGLMGNELAPFASTKEGNRLAHQYNCLYYFGDFCARPAFGDRYIRPFTDLEYLQLVARSTVRLGSKYFRAILLEAMDPKLSRFVNLNSAGHRAYHIPEKALHVATHEYDRSWYGWKMHRKLIFPSWPLKRHSSQKKYWSMYFSPLSHWGLASLCEHLLENGYKIEWGK